MNAPDSASTPGPVPVTTDANRQLLLRVLYMALFGVVFWIVCWVLAATTVVQLVLRLATGAPNADLQRFGGGLGRYAAQVVAFLTFATEGLPFPFTAWPEATDAPR